MASPVLIKNRYEIKDVLGRGGMGVVYKAFDTLMRREVAVKTLRDVASSVFVDLFYRECSVLTAMVHPNIVEIFDMGEFEEDGVLKPYFVMPLLPGRTLYDLIYPSGQPLPVERCTDIISQACRGLHAAHECGLLHRDIKPRNIFVMRDDAVKLIDFGVVRLLGSQTIGAPGTLGTLHYMAPEQIAMKPLTARSDIFSLATVCYEALTGVHPFVRENDGETAAAVNEHTPTLASALNPQINRPLAQAVAQAMAKDPRNRFESAAAFADALQRGLRNERPGATILTNPQNRLARAQRSFARGDYEFTQEIIAQLEAEGVDGPEVKELRAKLEEAVSLQQAEVHLATARRYFSEEEYVLARRRVAEVLDTDPSHQAARKLKNEIDEKINELHVADSLSRAAVHLDNGAFTETRRLIDGCLILQPNNMEAQRLLKEADQRAVEWPRQRQQQEELFQTAQTAYFEGRFDSSLRTLEQLAELTRQSKASGARVIEYKDFYKRVRGDFDALQAMLADARKLLANGDLESAFALSERLRDQCPQDPDVRNLHKDILARRDERDQDYRRGIARTIAGEPDLSARLHILNQAARARPSDEFFHQERQKLQAQLQQVTELVQRAQVYESSGRYDYAVEEWLCVGDVYPAYPGLKEQLARVKQVWKTAREQAKADLGVAVKQALKHGDQAQAAALLQAAHADFQGDPDYGQLKTLHETTAEAHKESASLLSRIQKAESERRFTDIPTLCQVAVAVSQPVDPLRQATFDALLGTAARVLGSNWRVAQQILQEAEKIGSVPDDLYQGLAREEREEAVSNLLGEERVTAAELDSYHQRVAALLEKYPGETRLQDRLRLVDAALEDRRREDATRSCVAELTLMYQELGDAQDHRRLWDTYIRAKNIAAPFAGNAEIDRALEAIRQQSVLFEQAADAVTRDRIKECFAICDSVLARRPGHVLFQRLRDHCDARHRQLGDEYLARVERWLASEPDVYQRELILQKAQEEYPFETRYSEELAQLQREKAMAESLAAKARDLQKRGQFPEALVQWRQLSHLHASYPGLDEQIAQCESVIDRAQRKARAQKLLAQGEAQLADGHYAQGYQMVHEAASVSDEIPDQLRFAAPNLVAGSRAVVSSNPKLAEAMVNLALTLDDALRLPKELRAKITEARKNEDTLESLKAIQAHHEAADLPGALAIADEFLARYPGLKQVESVRAHLLVEIEQQQKQEVCNQTLDQFRDMELGAVNMDAPELERLRQKVHELASRAPADEEVSQRASTLDSLFGSLAEVRSLLASHAAPQQIEEACARAFVKFPAHPLFKSALAELAKQKADNDARYLVDVGKRIEAESDFAKQTAILREALLRFPEDHDLLAQLSAVTAQQDQLNARADKARELEARRLFGEASKEWEAIIKDHPWYAAAAQEVERISNLRRKEKQDALDRWFGQVETAIEKCDYETASTMIKQAAQQQPDRKLQALDEKLKDALRKKEESDAKLAEGRALLADGDLVAGGRCVYRAFELQPNDKVKSNAISLLLLTQIRNHMATDLVGCESLLSHLNSMRPNQVLPPDVREALTKSRVAYNEGRANAQKMLDKLAIFAGQVDKARSPRALTSVRKRLQASEMLDSHDLEVRRAAGELLRQIIAKLSGFETPGKTPQREAAAEYQPFSTASVIAGTIFVGCLATLAFFWSRPHAGVPVQISVTPDHSTVELDGHFCVAPDCKFTLKPGTHVVSVRKVGYKSKSIPVNVKDTDATPLNVTAALEPLTDPLPEDALATSSLAKIQILGALPKTRVRLDGSDIGEVSVDGGFRVDVPPGPHTIDLSLDGVGNRSITRNFTRGEIVSLANEAVQLNPSQPNVRR